MDYRYQSPVGTFFIRQNPAGCELSIDGIAIGKYESVTDAWQDVARQSTGWDEWDLLAQADIPDLEKWEGVWAEKH